MEYRRRKKRRRNNYGYTAGNPSSGHNEGSSFLSALLILALTGGIIYMLLATSAGTWLAKNVFMPIFSGKKAAAQTPPPSLSQLRPPQMTKLRPKISILTELSFICCRWVYMLPKKIHQGLYRH